MFILHFLNGIFYIKWVDMSFMLQYKSISLTKELKNKPDSANQLSNSEFPYVSLKHETVLQSFMVLFIGTTYVKSF